MKGYIKIDRQIAEHWLWQDAERLKWWLDLLLMATWDDHKQLVGRRLIDLRRGQIVASLSYLCTRWKRSRSMVEPFLDLLQQDGMISKKVEHNISIITINNYDKYQTQENATIDAHLEAPQNPDIQRVSEKSGATIDAHLDTDVDAHLDATNKERIINILSTTSIKGEGEKKFFDELKSSQIWLEQMAMRFHLSPDQILKRIDDFALDCQCRGTTHSEFNDVRRHFNDWLRIQISVEQKQKKNDTDKTNGSDKRRATEVSATKAEDYTTSF